MCVCLGDFFDRSDLNSREITALKEIKWNKQILHYFIVGNHEMGIADLSNSSSHLFYNIPNSEVVDRSFIDTFENEGIELMFLPYILEENRLSINNYFPSKSASNKRILFTHNDLLGIQMGRFISKEGFSIEDLESVCDICFNGHLHNSTGKPISDKVYLSGNLTGQNFSEDATIYSHGMFILDTDTMKVTYLINPFAFNFYKIDLDNVSLRDINVLANSVCSIKCKEEQIEEVNRWLTDNCVLNSRVVITHDIENITNNDYDISTLTVDHVQQFNEYVLEHMENTEILLEELREVSK